MMQLIPQTDLEESRNDNDSSNININTNTNNNIGSKTQAPSLMLQANGTGTGTDNGASISIPIQMTGRARRHKPRARKVRQILPPPGFGVGVGAGTGTGTYHPEFMFCGDCTTCSVGNGNGNGNASAGESASASGLTQQQPLPPPHMMNMLTKLPTRKKRIAKMHFVKAGDMNIIENDEEMDMDMDMDSDHDNDDNNDHIDERESNSNNTATGAGQGLETVKLLISNLSTESQVLLLNSVLNPSSGATSVKTYLGNNSSSSSSSKSKSMSKSKTVDVTYDPLRISLSHMVGSLQNLNLDTSVMSHSKSKSNQQQQQQQHGSMSMHHQQIINEDEESSPSTKSSNRFKIRKTCRSSMHVDGICCSSEVPEVTSILRNLGNGVQKVSINITSRMVYVDHFTDADEGSGDRGILAVDLANALNKEGFGATVRKDGGIVRARKMKTNLKTTSTTRTGTPMAGESTAEFSPERIGLGNANANANANTESNSMNSSSTNAALFVESTLMCPSLSSEEEISIELIKEILEDQQLLLHNQVRHVLPNLASRTMKIEHNPKLVSAQTVADALMDSGGYTNVTVLVDGQKEGMILPDSIGGMVSMDSVSANFNWKGQRRCRKIQSFLPKGLGLSIVVSGICWVVSLVGHFDKDRTYLKYAGIVSVFFGIPSVAMKAFRTLRRGHFDANCMMVTAAFGAVLLQEFDEAASVSFLFSISEFLEDQATKKARLALDSIVNMRPDHANLIDPNSGDIEIVPVNDLEVGCLVSVRTGDQIPSDGVVVEGTSQIDESSLTGESTLATKQPGDIVSGGTMNAGTTRLVVRTSSLVEDSAVSRLIKLVEESASNRSPTEQIVDAFAKSYTPTVIFAALLMCTIPWFFGPEVGRKWTLNGLIIVVIACPCALTISTPVTYAAGLAATAKNGIIVKGGARLEALGSVKTIVFDKTGTLTEGKFRLNHLDVIGDHKTRREVLALLAIMEAPSSHPLAATFVNAAKQEGIQSSSDTTVIDHSILKGEGVRAFVDGKEVFVGNHKLFKRVGLYDSLEDGQKQKATEWDDEGGTVGFIGMQGIGIVGMFCVADGVRPEARDVIMALQNDGVNVMMLTGDGDGAAYAVAKEVGIPPECVRSQYLPEDKLHCVSSMLALSKRTGNFLSKKELLLFVGDGVNDAPALAVADVGVAMGAGAALAMEMSDVTLMDSNLSKLLYSIRMGTKVVMTVQENIAFSVAIKLIVIALTFAGKMTLLAAIAADVGVMLLVSLNGMKLLPGGRVCCKGRRRNYNKLSIGGYHPTDGEIV